MRYRAPNLDYDRSMARFTRNLIRRQKGPAPLPGARIVVGLGNPGPHYAHNRHNAGVRATADLLNLLGLKLADKSKHALSGQGETDYGPVVVAQPRTYMNESGQAVQSLLTIFEAKPESLILVVDELDIELGKIRVRPQGGDAGQRGMRSIKGVLGALDFPRVRIGVGRPYIDGVPSREPDVVADHLLSDPPRDEAAILRESEQRAAEAVLAILRDGVEAAMNAYNG